MERLQKVMAHAGVAFVESRKSLNKVVKVNGNH